MSNREVDVSVVIPLYNHESYVVSTLESVFSQSALPREVIVVDDGSADGSFDVVRKNFSNNKNLVLWSKSNEGAHHTINSGIYRATSSYVSILNSDDIYEKERLELCIDNLESDKAAVMVCSGISFIDGVGKSIKNSWYEQSVKFFNKNRDMALSLINGNFLMTTSNFFIRKSAFDRYGYFSKYRYVHDLSFLLEVLAQGGKINIIDRPLLKYRIHDTNTISEGVLKVKVELAAVIAEYVARRASSGEQMRPETFLDLYQILDAHNLSRMIFPFLAQMLKQGVSFGMGDILDDPDFSKLMLNIAK